MSRAVDLTVVSNEPTAWDRMQEYVSTVLSQSRQETRDKAARHLHDFSLYIARHGITNTSLNNYHNYLYNKGLSNCTVKNHFQNVRGFLRWCHKLGYSKIAWHLYLPKLKPIVYQQPKIIKHEEYLALRKACAGDVDKEWMVVLGYQSGMRMGDCCHLRWSQIDRKYQVISRVPRKNEWKTNKPCYIPYISGSDLHQLIEERWARKENEPYVGNDFVCPSFAMYYNVNGQSVGHIMKNVFRKAGLGHLSFKHFRSTFETRLANSGMNLSLAMAVTGRSSMETLARYVRVDHASARDGVGKALALHETSETFR